MKMLITVLALVLGTSVSFADHHEGHAKDAAAPTEAASGKMTKKEAKAACKSEGKKGKDLKHCVKEKTM